MAQNGLGDGAADPLEAAVQKLDRALSALEQAFAARIDRAHETDRAHEEDDLFEADRARMAAELAAARTRERALEDVAAEASAALGRAAAEVRAALAAEDR